MMKHYHLHYIIYTWTQKQKKDTRSMMKESKRNNDE